MDFPFTAVTTSNRLYVLTEGDRRKILERGAGDRFLVLESGAALNLNHVVSIEKVHRP